LNKSPGDHDRDLITSIAMGNREAFDELYVKYRRRLARFILRISWRSQDVEEIVNDTFMIVWRSAGGCRHASTVSTWIFGIAHHTALKSLRRQRRHHSNARLEEAPEQTTDPTLEMEMQDWLTCGLRQLPPDQRLTVATGLSIGSMSGRNRGNHGGPDWNRKDSPVSCASEAAQNSTKLGRPATIFLGRDSVTQFPTDSRTFTRADSGSALYLFARQNAAALRRGKGE
jgi:RNA polymerase sigma factor (sigma-70 family)